MVSKKQSKFIKSLKIKKYRSKEMCFFVEGRKNTVEGIASGLSLKYLLATSEFLKDNESELQFVESQVIECSPSDLKELGTFTTNNDCLAVFEIPEVSREIDFSDHVIVLDGVSDPGNLGTIIRTLDWYGINQLVCSADTTDLYSPKVLNATMGSYTRVRVYYQDLKEFLKDIPNPSYGADLEGIPLPELKSEKPIVLVMGSESHGISNSIGNLLTGKVTIPKIGEAESLNVAIATGILCHHLKFNLS
ncbi:TrmH family RNA methyltransferase [Marinoscillum pacificum]|uniref:TrmH family RNA methyltransferase n=1 Tax=Marinoscillum pacificum TaxID=392723 RepID=UPI00215826D3|nr:RNA methyltransferase [Marinoscillum pacificum]